MANGETMEIVRDFIFLGSKITVDGNCSHEIKRCLLLERQAMTNLESVLKKQRHHFPDNITCSQSYGFSYSYVWMWDLDCKESWAPKYWCFCIVVLEKTVESLSDSKEIKPVNPKGNQSWIFIGRTDAKTEAPILWTPDELTHWKRSWFWERLKAEGEGNNRGWDGWISLMIQWIWVWANLGDSEEQGSLVCCSPWGHKESDMTEWLDNKN